MKKLFLIVNLYIAIVNSLYSQTFIDSLVVLEPASIMIKIHFDDKCIDQDLVNNSKRNLKSQIQSISKEINLFDDIKWDTINKNRYDSSIFSFFSKSRDYFNYSNSKFKLPEYIEEIINKSNYRYFALICYYGFSKTEATVRKNDTKLVLTYILTGVAIDIPSSGTRLTLLVYDKKIKKPVFFIKKSKADCEPNWTEVYEYFVRKTYGKWYKLNLNIKKYQRK